MISMSRIEKKTESEMTEDSMAETTADTDERSDEEAKLDPRALAKSVVLAVADEPDEVGEFVQGIDLGDNVADFRFVCLRKGYEGWQWAVTLYHDTELDSWSVNESTLVPTEDSLLAPAWVPWKDRLEAADLSVTDSLGTDPDDPRMEDGFRKTKAVQQDSAEDAGTGRAEGSGEHATGEVVTDVSGVAQSDEETTADGEADGEAKTAEAAQTDLNIDPETGLSRELEDTVEQFGLSRRHVMSQLGRSQTAKRWYDGQHGPKSLSTKTAEGNLCSTCAFFIGLKGDLDTMFGVCANRWSPDDGRVVSLDHGCGEHSEIAQPEPSHLWVQSKPAFDDLHIDIIAQAPREERGQVELIESIDEDDDNVDAQSDEADDETETDVASETDIAEHAVPGSLDDDDESDDDADETTVVGKGTVGSAVTAEVAVESTIDLSDDGDGSDDSDDADDADGDSVGSDAEDDDSDEDEPDTNISDSYIADDVEDAETLDSTSKANASDEAETETPQGERVNDADDNDTEEPSETGEAEAGLAAQESASSAMPSAQTQPGSDDE